MLNVEQLKRAGYLIERVQDLQRWLIAFEKADSFNIEVVANNGASFTIEDVPRRLTIEDVPHTRLIQTLFSCMRATVAKDKDELATLGVEWTAADDAAIEAAVAEPPGDDDELPF